MRKARKTGIPTRTLGCQTLVSRTGTELAETYVSRPHILSREEHCNIRDAVGQESSTLNLKKGKDYSTRLVEVTMSDANIWQNQI